MSAGGRAALWVLGVLQLRGLAQGRRMTAQVAPATRWHYIDQFVFDVADSYFGTGPPSLQYWVVPDTRDPFQADSYALVMYDDETFSWPAAYGMATEDELWQRNATGTCEQLSRGCSFCSSCMMKLCSGPDRLGSQCRNVSAGARTCLPGGWGDDWERERTSVAPGGDYYTGCPAGTELCATDRWPTEAYIRQSARPRFWYAAVVNCGLQHDVGITMELEWRNPGGWWRSHFSVDRQGLLEMYTLYVPLGLALCFAYAARLWMAQREQGEGAYLHFVLKWWAVTVLCQMASFVFFWGHYLSYAGDGRGHPGVMWTAVALRCLAALLFIILLLAFSTGFTVVGVSFSTPLMAPLQRQRKILLFIFAVLVIFNVIMYCLTASAMSNMPETVLHDNPYQTWAGILLACLRLPIAGYYLYNLNGTVRAAPEMLRFYQMWGGGFLVYILFLPVAMLLAHVASPWVMYRAVECSVDTVTFAAFVAMGALLWPGNRAQSALARTYTVADSGPSHMPIGDFGSALPTGPNRGGSFTSNPAASQQLRGQGGSTGLLDEEGDVQMRGLDVEH
eukprot:TRINITY_DN8185_c0_g2_i1.p1 TRINITY_DN8185_c0_g2~~TRINITY_DN8185_c0_g2_i1.p1  ORF type:complete len:562 (+),score=144.14 TRINITY_DN8185_c0_g2_i1:86-1771(+)